MWSLDRRLEVQTLEDMLNDIQSLNNGTNFIGRVQKIIEQAEFICKTELGSGRKSLLAYIRDQALKP